MWFRSYRYQNDSSVMSLEDSKRSQRPYRYGMVLLCVGALINWLGLAEDYVEPVRYIGVACIIAGALLICTAMCCWLHSSTNRENQSTSNDAEQGNGIHVINVDPDIQQQKPPDYDTVAGAPPPSYDDAIKLDPSQLLLCSTSNSESTQIHIEGAVVPPGMVLQEISEESLPNTSSVAIKPPSSPPPAYSALGDR